MEQYIQWALGVLFVLILGSFKYAQSVSGKLDELSKFVYQLPCVDTDVEAELEKLKARMDAYEAVDLKDAVGFHAGRVDDHDGPIGQRG